MRYVGLVFTVAMLVTAGIAGAAPAPANSVSGHYVEVRTCDVYTGFCFANSEMGLAGKEAILAWAIDKGTWDGIVLDGLKVVAAVKTDATLGDVRAYKGQSKAALVVDANADVAQRKALVSFAQAMGGDLLKDIATVTSAPVEASVGQCTKGGCAFIKAGGIVEISTRCLGGDDHVCGNEETFYPPLTSVDNPSPAFTELAKFDGDGLGLKWRDTGSRSAFLATFSV